MSKEKPAEETPKKGSDAQSSEFMHRVRLAGVIVDGNMPVTTALRQIKGIGYRTAVAVIPALGVDEKTKIGSLSEKKIADIEKTLEGMDKKLPAWMLNRQKDRATGDDTHLLGPDLDMARREDINLQKKIKSYRGVRHHLKLPVRGQRTRSSFRTGGTLGVKRKKG